MRKLPSQGDVAEAVAALKQSDGADLLVIGSTEVGADAVWRRPAALGSRR